MLKRIVSAVIGVPLLLVTAFEAYLQSFGFYAEHYTIPMEKLGVRTAIRWQDIVFLVLFWPIAIMLFYVSYRLLKHAFRRELRERDSSGGGPEPATARTSH
jgi:hypothetical protein